MKDTVRTAVLNLFSGSVFCRSWESNWLFYGTVEGIIIGVVIATYNFKYNAFNLNKRELRLGQRQDPRGLRGDDQRTHLRRRGRGQEGMGAAQRCGAHRGAVRPVLGDPRLIRRRRPVRRADVMKKGLPRTRWFTSSRRGGRSIPLRGR